LKPRLHCAIGERRDLPVARLFLPHAARAWGLLVTGALSEGGTVAPFSVLSEQGRPFVFLTPWPRLRDPPKVFDISEFFHEKRLINASN
jgi:hypothetical protein